ncbi:MAG TPA: SRPBCC domain-containing protein [Chitinophagaceae bacterium]|nr:SRPBCC domain-containing protein [Chitinophagaceae bacterium]
MITTNPATTTNSKIINAKPEYLYHAFTDPNALAVWLAPGEMTGKVHPFDFKTGGGYEMSLFYPSFEKEMRGKTSEKEDRFTAKFVELTPPKKIVQAINFNSNDPAFSGEIIMETTFEPENNRTKVTITFKNIPPGIRPEDNEAGTESTLKKLARYVEGG